MSARAEDHPADSLAPYAATLVDVAHRSIDHGLRHGAELTPAADAYPDPLRAERASFVTLLDAAGSLRGCIGSIEATRPLVEDVASNAFAAAFRDPRFPPVGAAERGGLQCKLSVLTPPEHLPFTDEADLLQRIEPGVDGLLLDAGDRRGTLLPAVWEHIPDATSFWATLKQKAGLPPDSPADGLTVYRYRAEELEAGTS